MTSSKLKRVTDVFFITHILQEYVDLRVYFKGSIREVIEAILDLSICKNNHCHSLALARIFHESAYGGPRIWAVLPGVLGCSFDRLRTGSPCDVPFRYASKPIPRCRGTVALWHAHLRGLATAIHEICGLEGPVR
jgi:hypothetical protein